MDDIPFEEEALCEWCGVEGAFDFMGDYICTECANLDEEDNE